MYYPTDDIIKRMKWAILTRIHNTQCLCFLHVAFTIVYTCSTVQYNTIQYSTVRTQFHSKSNSILLCWILIILRQIDTHLFGFYLIIFIILFHFLIYFASFLFRFPLFLFFAFGYVSILCWCCNMLNVEILYMHILYTYIFMCCCVIHNVYCVCCFCVYISCSCVIARVYRFQLFWFGFHQFGVFTSSISYIFALFFA